MNENEKNENEEEDSGDESVSDEDLREDPNYIEDYDTRIECFKALYSSLILEIHKYSTYNMEPENLKNEAMMIIATPSGSILTRATDKLSPMVSSPEGKKAIGTVLETSLKMLAKNLDPNIYDPELAKVEYEKNREKK